MVAKLATKKDRSKYLTDLSTGVYSPGLNAYDDVVSVISQHACFAEKAAAGMVAIRVGHHPVYKKYKVVYIQHPDGTSSDIRFTKSYPKAPIRGVVHVKCAMRTAVGDQTLQYKEASFSAHSQLHCANCKCHLVWSGTQVDHVVKFRDLYSSFLVARGDHKHPLVDNGESGMTRRFSEDDEEHVQAWHWQQYHRENAVLQLVCAPCNRKMR